MRRVQLARLCMVKLKHAELKRTKYPKLDASILKSSSRKHFVQSNSSVIVCGGSRSFGATIICAGSASLWNPTNAGVSYNTFFIERINRQNCEIFDRNVRCASFIFFFRRMSFLKIPFMDGMLKSSEELIESQFTILHFKTIYKKLVGKFVKPSKVSGSRTFSFTNKKFSHENFISRITFIFRKFEQ